MKLECIILNFLSCTKKRNLHLFTAIPNYATDNFIIVMLIINKNYKPACRELIVKRRIHPVGHGAFVTEQFCDDDGNCEFTVVYDCGSRSKSLIEDAIKAFVNDGLKINVLFISHFDKDHVNGLPALSKYFSRDIKVFIPLYYMQLLPIYHPNKAQAIKLVLKTLKAYNIKPILVTYNPSVYADTTIDITEYPKNGRIISGTRLRYRVNDVTGDGRVDVEDVNAIINLILKLG